MLKNSNRQSAISNQHGRLRIRTSYLLLVASCFLATACGVRFDMQDQPRYKAYKQSDFFADNRASRNLPEGTVARGFLKEDKALHTGKIGNPNLNAQVETTTDASGNTLVSSFPNSVQTVQGLRDRVTLAITTGLPVDFYATYRDRLAALTAADAHAAAARVLRPDTPTVVVVGDLRTVEPRVRALNLGTVEVWDADGNRVR